MKRKYTVSDKVLAANRRNLEKANAVPKSIRYRATERRVASCHANLQKARAAQCDRQHPRRRGPMAHGFQVVDLDRTAAQAGERVEDLEHHRALFLKKFGGNREQSRLARALADIFWRRWRALAWEAEREAKQFYSRLVEHPDPASGISRAELETSRALDCLVILGGLVALSERLGRLSRRFERLARTWIGLHTDAPVSLPFGTRPSISRIEWEHWKQSQDALSNPFLSSGEVAQRLEQSHKPPRPLDPPEQWRPWGSGAPIENRQSTIENQVDLPADFEAHRERLEAAFGKASEEVMQRAARLTWQRLKLIGEHLEKEQKALAQLFDAKLDPAALLARLVALVAADGALMQQAHALERQFQQALYEWLTEQEPGACYEALRPGQKPVSVASTLLAELDELDKELGFNDKWEPDDGWERDEEAWKRR